MAMNEVGQRLLARVQGVDALRWSALAGTLGFGALVTLFVGGDAVTDPGGWAGIGGTAVFVLVVGALCLLAWYHAGASFAVLAVAASAPLAFGVWSLVDYGAAHDWEDSHGPLSLVLVVAICAPAGVAGLFRPRAAGYLILTVSVVPLLLAAVGATSHFYEPLSVGLLLAPIVASGILFLLSGRQQGQRGNPVVTDLRH
ncbi:hypothetical protein GCM10009845_12600 [Pedococcus bigeumensis]|jgi:hypothetical protein